MLNAQERSGFTRKKTITLTDDGREQIQAFAEAHQMTFSAAIETLALVGLEADLTTLLVPLINNSVSKGMQRQFNRMAKLGVLAAAFVIWLTGLIDDLRDVSAPAKVAGMVLSGSILTINAEGCGGKADQRRSGRHVARLAGSIAGVLRETRERATEKDDKPLRHHKPSDAKVASSSNVAEAGSPTRKIFSAAAPVP